MQVLNYFFVFTPESTRLLPLLTMIHELGRATLGDINERSTEKPVRGNSGPTTVSGAQDSVILLDGQLGYRCC